MDQAKIWRRTGRDKIRTKRHVGSFRARDHEWFGRAVGKYRRSTRSRSGSFTDEKFNQKRTVRANHSVYNRNRSICEYNGDLYSRRAIKIGDKEVEYNSSFRLILHTKLANPHYKPEIQAQTTLINFTVTRDGLEDQLLAEVVKAERPDLEETKVLNTI